MPRRVTVDSLTVEEHAKYRALSKQYEGGPKAARAIFRAGLNVIKVVASAPSAPVAPPAPAALPTPDVTVLLDEDEGEDV